MNQEVKEKKLLGILPSSKTKRVGCFAILFLGVFALIIGIIGFLWAGGWVNDITCSIVLEDSYIWEKAGCKKENVTNSDWQENVIEMDLPAETESTEELVIDIIEQASPAVVTVAVDTLEYDYEKGYVDGQDGIGSGFVVDKDGLIVTNQHVVSDERADYSVILPGEDEAVPVEKIYRDNINDIAILRVNRSDLKALKLGDSEKLKRGNLVVAIGNPFGDLAGTATVGFITGLNREVTASSGFFGEDVRNYEGVIQTDAAINPGNSGGPLLNSEGDVIGINFATTSGADNISFAIPINHLKSRLEIFEKEGKLPQPYIGVSYNNRTVFYKDDIITGAVILDVEVDSPAENAGIEAGDIIIEVDGFDMSEYSLASVISSAEVGKKLDMKVWREGETSDIEVEVGDKSD